MTNPDSGSDIDKILDRYADPDMCVAIVGVGLRLPGADNPDELWKNLVEGRRSIHQFSPEQIAKFTGRDPSPSLIPYYGQINGVDRFDYDFFNLTPSEALIMDPQHRIFLECCWEAFEDAGVVPENSRLRVGVFAGQSESEYLQLLYRERDRATHKQDSSENQKKYSGPVWASDWQLRLATGLDFLATRVSYAFNLTGPAMTIQTGCSTSLVSVIQAVQSLILGDCDLALAGGSSVHYIPRFGEYNEGSILDPRGKCQAFDADAKGTVASNGVAVVLLKRLEDALRDGDNIQSVVIGYMANNDGRAKVGFTAPSIEGQSRAIKGALINGSIDPASISFIECHGTGTPLGDPIEIAALKKAFGAGWTSADREKKITLGSIKSNIGHTDAAAGAAGLIKMLLSLKHGTKPPSLDFSKPNPALGIEESPFAIQQERELWTGDQKRGAVSSFGIGGTNAHVVLEEAPVEPPESTAEYIIVPVSGHTSEATRIYAERIKHAIETRPPSQIGNLAYTLQVGRKEFSFRRAYVFKQNQSISLNPAVIDANCDETVWLFAGHGSQYKGMAIELYQRHALFRDTCDHVARLFNSHGIDISPLFVRFNDENNENKANEDVSQKLDLMTYSQAFNFCVQYAMGCLLKKVLRKPPKALVAHSLGMFAAATLAGVFSLEDAVAIVALRSRLFDQAPEGKMLAVKGAYEHSLIRDADVSVAAINQKDQFVLSGAKIAIDALALRLESSGYEVKALRISSAAHSHLMNSSYDTYLKLLKRIQYSPPLIQLYSDLTGDILSPEQATSPDYWASHLNSTVAFSSVIENLAGRLENTVLVEIGAGRTLTSLITSTHQVPAVLSVPHALDEECSHFFFKKCIARLWELGIGIKWGHVEDHHPLVRKISVPVRSFERKKLKLGNYDLDILHQQTAPRENDSSLVSSSAMSLAVSLAMSNSSTLTQEILSVADSPNRFENLEARIVALFAQVTGRSSLDSNSNFFRLGGDSLMSLQVLKVLRSELEIKIPAKSIFQNPTPHLLAQFLREAQNA